MFNVTTAISTAAQSSSRTHVINDDFIARHLFIENIVSFIYSLAKQIKYRLFQHSQIKHFAETHIDEFNN